MQVFNSESSSKFDSCLCIKAVGDIAPGDFSINGLGVYSLTKRYGCDFVFQKIVNALGNYDLLIGNLEDSLSHCCLTKDLRHCGLPDMAHALHQIGFDVLSLANNHSFDHGSDILLETIYHCENAGIKLAGLRGKSEYYCQPVIIKKHQMIVGILAYNWVGLEDAGKIGDYLAVVEDSVVNYTWYRDKARDFEKRKLIKEKNKNAINDIKKLRNEVDLLILMPHWGYEWTIYPPYGVILEGRNFIEAGVDLIIGSHPHVPQGIEKYNDGLIAYSMGNFLFDSVTDKFKYGMVLECKVNPGSIENFSLTFIKRGENFQPEPVTEEEAAENRRLIDKSSKAISSIKAEQILDDDVIYKEYETQYYNLKYQKIIYLLMNLPSKPYLIKSIFKKVLNFLYLILLRLQGKKTRW
jgi:poly-gamma-glutamate synthesis protein (capsule biosynthesis protein)